MVAFDLRLMKINERKDLGRKISIMMRFSRGCNQVKLKKGATTVANTGVSFVGAVATAVAVAATVPIVLCRCCCLVTAATSANALAQLPII